MNRLKQDAVLTALVDGLDQKGSWCGETHVQKATYFLQELRKVPLGFNFILYKHGPFSFDLRDELTAMRADGFFDLRSQWPYGSSLVPTHRSRALREDFPKTLARYSVDINFVCDALGLLNVAELEKLATALYVSFDFPGASERAQAKALHELKPHIPLTDSLDAVRRVNDLIEQSN